VKNFALTGAAGCIAPRHLQAIRDTGHRLVAAADPHDSVGILDSFFPDTAYFKEIERFDRHLEKLRRGPEAERVHYLSVCSPNFLHDAHIRMALRVGAHVICEKPLVLNPWNLDLLSEQERENYGRIYCVLQVRLHPSIIALRERIGRSTAVQKHDIELTYITGRGRWYHYSWKGDTERSGGLATNIGIHFFDMLLWIFGPLQHAEVHLSHTHYQSGYLELERARVRWYLSVDTADLPFDPIPGQKTTWRSIRIDGEELEFTQGFTDLHTRLYEKVLAGEGYGLEDCRPSIELAYRIRTATPSRSTEQFMHPLTVKKLTGL